MTYSGDPRSGDASLESSLSTVSRVAIISLGSTAAAMAHINPIVRNFILVLVGVGDFQYHAEESASVVLELLQLTVYFFVIVALLAVRLRQT